VQAAMRRAVYQRHGVRCSCKLFPTTGRDSAHYCRIIIIIIIIIIITDLITLHSIYLPGNLHLFPTVGGNGLSGEGNSSYPLKVKVRIVRNLRNI